MKLYEGGLMSKWKIACGAAILAASLAPSAHADEFTKLTMMTFSGPVDVPGITLPAGTYRFELADPTSSRRVVRVSDKDGSKTYGMFISLPNQRMTPTDKPVVMFKEAAAGAPPAVQVWFYPGETYGYEFAYPHDQALKIARATHESVLAYTDHSTASTTDEDRMASMKNAEIGRIDENDKPISTDETLKESSEPRTPVATTGSTSASAASSTAPVSTPAAASSTPASTTETASSIAPASSTAPASTTTAASTTAPASSAAPASSTAPVATTAEAATPAPTVAPAPAASETAVGTSGRASSVPAPTSMTGSAPSTADAAKPARKHLPKTASQLPLIAIFSALALAGGFGVRLVRQGAL
jgi:hypothetical protein